MAAKIQIINDRINSFGGIFFIIDQFRSSGLAALVDKILGIKGINTRYSYSNVIENLTSVFVSGGEVLEDVNFFRQEAFKANPDYRFCSAATGLWCSARSCKTSSPPCSTATFIAAY